MPFPFPPSLPRDALPAPLELGLEGPLSLLDMLQAESPAQWPIWPHAVQAEVLLRSSIDRGLPENFLPSTVDCNLRDVTVKTFARS